jgi:hypothetical protein
MQSTSSVPPPHQRVTPFLAKKEKREGRCYISGQSIAPIDKVVMIPMDGGKKHCPVKLIVLLDALEISSEDEKQQFCHSFIALNSEGKYELAWFKLSRYKPTLFSLLLMKFNTL